MGARRTAEQIFADLYGQWITWKHEWYAHVGKCSKCGAHGFVAGREYRGMRCAACHFGKHLPRYEEERKRGR